MGEGRTPAWRSAVGTETKDPPIALADRFFSVMPPSFPHAVYTPDNCLMVGGQTYTMGNLGRSIEGLKVQADCPDISNENLYDSVYDTMATFLTRCGPITTPVEKAQIASSCTLFTLASPAKYDLLTKADLAAILKSRKVVFGSKTDRRGLVQLLEEHDRKTSGRELGRTPRDEFHTAARRFCREYVEQMLS